MGSTSYASKSKAGGYKTKSGSSVGSDKEMNGKLRRTKIRRPGKMTDYGMKRIPDYTELAYKEAVSKLRYFLSGNYSPSVRSYGGSASIKNLDESDADLDKKYGNTSEFKPRPRLTQKYATLYADSFQNYAPPTGAYVPPATAPAAATSDLSGGTNPDVINFIQKQEEYIEQLERESQYCRDELNNLLGKVKEVISENEHLHEAQKNKLISRMFHTYNAGSETDELDDLGDSTGLDLDSDHKNAPSKGRRTSFKSRSTKLEGPNIVFESRIAELEAQLTQARIDLKKLQEENNENKRKLASGLVDSTCLDGFKRQIDNLQRDKSSLESQISKLKLSLENKDGDLDGRYKRGSDAIEHQLREERNNLEAELRRLKEDLAKERSKVRELASDGARRAIQERSAAEQRYNAHFDELSHDLAAQYDNVAKLQLELERQRRDDNDLKREISMKNAAIEELKMELKNKSSSLQADLAQAHAEKASLDEELASARLAIERHQRQSKHETNRLNSEIQSLRQRLDRADADLVHSRRENLRLSEQIATLEKEINMKNLTPMSPEKNKKDKEFSSMLESMENKHAKTVAELETMIQSQNSLMEKLTGECRLLTDKLDDANRRHKMERVQLLCRNSELMKKLRSLWCSHKKYCTSTIAPRSYTPISGYPNSRSSYDLDRTYNTSTPYTNRYSRYRSGKDGIGNLIRCLSDLSIDKYGYSDDDPVKFCECLSDTTVCMCCYRKELATLHRQVDHLGRSMQQSSTPDSTRYQAPPTHPYSANRNDEHPATSPGPGNTRADPARQSQISRQPSNSDLAKNREHSNSQSRQLSRQASVKSINLEKTPQSVVAQPYEETHEDAAEKDIGSDNPQKEAYKAPISSTMEAEHNQQYEQEYEQDQPNYDQNAPEYVADTADYQNQGYEQNYEQQAQDYQQPAQNVEQLEGNYQQPEQNYEQQPQDYQEQQYTEGQYPENYEQQQYADQQHYPDQQYVDPNAQYDPQQYENYVQDPNYQNVEGYENQDFDNATPGYTPQAQDVSATQEIPEKDYSESKRSNSPNEKVKAQS